MSLLGAYLILSGSVPAAQRAGAANPPAALTLEDLRPPTELVACASGNSVELRWRDNSSAETGFVVRRRQAGVFQNIGFTAPDETSFTDLGLPNGTFVYQVVALGELHGNPFESLPSNRARARIPDLPPVITTDLPANPQLYPATVLRFHVTVTDPDGDPVSLKILNPPPGMVFAPLVHAPSPATMEVRWSRTLHEEIRPRLVFSTNCGVRLEKDVALPDFAQGLPEYQAGGDAGLLIGDMTGDGVMDAIALAERAGTSDTGAIYVFAGARVPQAAPSATLRAGGGSLRPRNNSTRFFAQLADVTGDGVLDVVSTALSQAIYVWAGGSGLSGTPSSSAVLVPPGTSASSSPDGDCIAPLLQFADLDADGTDDIVTFDRLADVGGVPDAGAVFVWLGGAALTGTLSPTRVLSVPGAVTGEWLGLGANSDRQGCVVLADVTDDGTLDFLVLAARADVGGVVDAGAIYLWSGADVLAGPSAPAATLTAPGFEQTLGTPLLADLTGDGRLDVVAGRAGAFHLWEGGSLSGSVPATCTFQVADPILRFFCFADVSGDGVLDFVALSTNADFGGVQESGAIQVWTGGALSGTPAPTATLGDPGAEPFDWLGTLFSWPLLVRDMTGDGILDLVSASLRADSGGTEDTGAIYLWSGGSIAGDIAPAAILRVPGALDNTNLSQFGVWIEDVDTDGTLDVLSMAWTDGTRTDAQVHAWSGAAGWSGVMPSTLTLDDPSPRGLDRVRYVDLDGDGVLDVLASGLDSGELRYWRGGPGFFGAAGPSAILGSSSSGDPDWFDFLDWNADGIVDLCTTDYFADVSVTGAGLVDVWLGRPSWSGTVAPSFTLTGPAALAFDSLGSRGLRFADLTGDGVLDLLANSPDADLSPALHNTGAVYCWDGFELLSGAGAPPVAFADPDAEALDRLGESNY